MKLNIFLLIVEDFNKYILNGCIYHMIKYVIDFSKKNAKKKFSEKLDQRLHNTYTLIPTI